MVQWVEDRHCHFCGSGYSCGRFLIPGQKTSTCQGYSPKKEKKKLEFPLWFSRLRTRHSDCKVTGLISGLPQGIKDPALLQDAA